MKIKKGPVGCAVIAMGVVLVAGLSEQWATPVAWAYAMWAGLGAMGIAILDSKGQSFGIAPFAGRGMWLLALVGGPLVLWIALRRSYELACRSCGTTTAISGWPRIDCPACGSEHPELTRAANELLSSKK